MATKKDKKPEKAKFKKAGPKFSKDKFRKFMLGTKDTMGFLKTFLAYVALISIGFIFLYPIFKMLSMSFMTLDDLLNTSINWIPSSLYKTNYKAAMTALNFWKALKDSIILAGVPTLIQVCIAAFVGYGFARFDFRGKKLCMALLIFSFVLPAQIITTPTYVLYSTMGLTGSIWAFIVPAILGQGIKAPIFILITMTFYKQVPQSLIEAAHMDGAGYLKSFFRIALPSASGALIVVLLFSFVWYWNETYLTGLYVTRTVRGQAYKWDSLIMGLGQFDNNFATTNASITAGGTTANVNEAYRMAGTMLSILPLLILYFVMQRYFVESIDRVGITGE